VVGRARSFLKIPRWADASGAEPVLPLGLTPRPSQGGHDDYQTDEADGAAILVSRGMKVLHAAPAASMTRCCPSTECFRPTYAAGQLPRQQREASGVQGPAMRPPGRPTGGGRIRAGCPRHGPVRAEVCLQAERSHSSIRASVAPSSSGCCEKRADAGCPILARVGTQLPFERARIQLRMLSISPPTPHETRETRLRFLVCAQPACTGTSARRGLSMFFITWCHSQRTKRLATAAQVTLPLLPRSRNDAANFCQRGW